MKTIQDLRGTLPRPGAVEWLGLRPARRAPVQAHEQVEAHPLVGLIGDHGKLAPPRLTALTGHAGEAARPVSAAVPGGPPAPGGAPGIPGGPGRRQVTLIQAEHLPVIAALAGLAAVDPGQLRRNIMVSGLPLLALKGRRFQIGEVILEGTGECHPCSRMEETLGQGGYNAVRGHGGLTARVIRGGVIRLGDEVRALSGPVSQLSGPVS